MLYRNPEQSGVGQAGAVAGLTAGLIPEEFVVGGNAAGSAAGADSLSGLKSSAIPIPVSGFVGAEVQVTGAAIPPAIPHCKYREAACRVEQEKVVFTWEQGQTEMALCSDSCSAAKNGVCDEGRGTAWPPEPYEGLQVERPALAAPEPNSLRQLACCLGWVHSVAWWAR